MRAGSIVAAIAVASNVCWSEPPARPVQAEPEPSGDSSGETLALQLVKTAEAAALAGDCASASRLGPAVYSADRTVYQLVFLPSPTLAKCDIAPVVVPPAATPSASVPPATPPPPVIAHDTPGSGRVTFGKLAIGAGGALWIASVVLGIDARDSRDQARAAGCNSDLSMCPNTAYTDAFDAYTRGNQATDVFVAGAVLVGVGALLWYTGSNAGHQVQVAPAADAHEIGLVISGGL